MNRHMKDKCIVVKCVSVYCKASVLKAVLQSDVFNVNLYKQVPRMKSPLFSLCMKNGRAKQSPEKVQILIDNGIDVNERDSKGKTPLDYAREGKTARHKQIVNMLIKAESKSQQAPNGLGNAIYWKAWF